MDTTSETFQISTEAAEAYEAAFVPAFFDQWVPLLLDAAHVGPGQRVLDVACGTGVVARHAADRVGGAGAVTGLDLNEAMLAVARRVRPDITWRRGDAAELPFPDASFDVVACQMALMFFPDAERAIAEMGRVTAPGGVVAINVPAALSEQQAFAAFVDMVAEHASRDAANLLTSYFACGDLDQLTALLTAAGLREISARTEHGRYRAPSIDVAVTTEVESTPLRERIDEQTYEQIRADAHTVWRRYTTADGALDTPFATHVVTARRTRR
ncbi:MAG: methyltransferase domain-containing protein [Pseudonocardia sp.]